MEDDNDDKAMASENAPTGPQRRSLGWQPLEDGRKIYYTHIRMTIRSLVVAYDHREAEFRCL